MNLQCPKSWLEADPAWPGLLRRLFPHLKAIVARGQPDELTSAEGEFGTWQSYIDRNAPARPALTGQFQAARRLFACARLAIQGAGQPPPAEHELDFATFTLSDLPAELRGHGSWALHCIRQLSPQPAWRGTARPARVTVALNDPGGGPARLATLAVDVLQPGAGQAFQSPEFGLHTWADPTFTNSLGVAWHAARALAAQGGEPLLADLSWRLLGPDGKDLPEVQGPSASGAAALAALLALRGQTPDEHLIVLAECRSDGALAEVGDLPAKVRAVAASGRFDTIVVATEQARQEAEAALAGHSGLRVRVAPTLAALAAQRSWLVEELERYCTSLIEKLDRTPWFRQGQRIRASAVAVPVRVLKESTRPEPRRPGPRGEEGAEPDEPQRREAARDYVDPQIAALYEEAAGEKRQEEVPWAQERLQLRRALVLGGPGSGKSFLTQTTAIELARGVLDLLQERRRGLEAVELPLHFTLASLAGPDLPADPADALLRLVEQGFSPAPCFLGWLKPRLRAHTTWLLLDALDEVREHERPMLTERLRAIETQGWQTRVLLTCRPANYSRQQVPWGNLTEYELALFNPLEIRGFVERWFAAGPVGAGRSRSQDVGRALTSAATNLIQALDRNFPLAHAARTPLIASFLCLAHEEAPVTATTRRAELYGRLMRGLARRAWKEKPLATTDPHVDDLVVFLVRISRPLFQRHPAGNLFTHAEITEALEQCQKLPEPLAAREARQANQPIPLPQTWRTLLRDELLETGILVGAGLREGIETQFSFAHRSLLEYLVARHLAAGLETRPVGAPGLQPTPGAAQPCRPRAH